MLDSKFGRPWIRIAALEQRMPRGIQEKMRQERTKGEGQNTQQAVNKTNVHLRNWGVFVEGGWRREGKSVWLQRRGKNNANWCKVKTLSQSDQDHVLLLWCRHEALIAITEKCRERKIPLLKPCSLSCVQTDTQQANFPVHLCRLEVNKCSKNGLTTLIQEIQPAACNRLQSAMAVNCETEQNHTCVPTCRLVLAP